MSDEKQEVKETQEQPELNIKGMLNNMPGHPSEEQIQVWKKQYSGDVWAAMIGGKGEIYIFRSINRSEWKNLQEQIAQSQSAPEILFKEHIVKRATLWPDLKNPEFFAALKAGIVPTLYEQITFYSGFMDPAVAIQMVYEL